MSAPVELLRMAVTDEIICSVEGAGSVKSNALDLNLVKDVLIAATQASKGASS